MILVIRKILKMPYKTFVRARKTYYFAKHRYVKISEIMELKKALVYLGVYLTPIAILSSINMYVVFNLTNIARENYYYKTQSVILSREIDQLKDEIRYDLNINIIKSYANENNFKYEENPNYIK